MSTFTEINELRQLIEGVRQCAASLLATYGDCRANRRIVNDVECILNGIHRLEIDVEEVEMSRGFSQSNGTGEMIQIPDADYHIDFWQDVDHEGIGGHRNVGARISQTHESTRKSRRSA
jgi:hypothetical protein